MSSPPRTRLCDSDKPDIRRLLYFLEVEAAKLTPHLNCLVGEVRSSAFGHGFRHEGLNSGPIAAVERSQPRLELPGSRRVWKREMGLRCGRLGREPRQVRHF